MTNELEDTIRNEKEIIRHINWMKGENKSGMEAKIDFMEKLRDIIEFTLPIAKHLLEHGNNLEISLPYLLHHDHWFTSMFEFEDRLRFDLCKTGRGFKGVDVIEYRDVLTKENALDYFNSDFLTFDKYLEHINNQEK